MIYYGKNFWEGFGVQLRKKNLCRNSGRLQKDIEEQLMKIFQLKNLNKLLEKIQEELKKD